MVWGWGGDTCQKLVYVKLTTFDFFRVDFFAFGESE